MLLEFLMSASGHGKTFKLYDRLIQESIASKDNSRKFILVVPEQSSLQAQKDIVRLHPNGGVFNIDVVTFGRMAYRIFEELGIEPAKTIDDTGKNLILRKAVSKVEERLKIIHPNGKQGFITEIKSMISELKQYGITVEELRRIIEEINASDRLKQKLADLLEVYEAFQDSINGKYITFEDRPEELLKVIHKSSFFNNAVVAFDGFTGFTPVQYRIIEHILTCAERVITTVTIPRDESVGITGEEDLFYMSKSLMSKMGRIADRLGIPTEYNRIETDREKFRFAKSSELDFLENELFRYDGKVYEGEVEDIILRQSDTPKGEVCLAAAYILHRVRENGLRFREIALIAGDMELYGDDIQRIFTESQIPFFMDRKRSLIGNPAVEYIRAALEVVSDNYSYDSVFRFLKNDICGLDKNQTDRLENYVLAFGIRGRNRWREMFMRKYPGKGADLGEINTARVMFTERINKFDEAFSNKKNSVRFMVRAVYDLMEDGSVYEYMEKLAEHMEADCGNVDSMARAMEYRMTYDRIIELLEQIDSLMGDEEISVEEFISIMDAGFEEIKVGIIPPSVDCVTVGDVERTRLEHVKVLFILGANEGIFPKTSTRRSFLSENERKILGDNSVELAPSARQQVFIQNFYIYLNMTEPENALYVMCHKFSAGGKDSKPSRIINMLFKMYPSLKMYSEGELEPEELITNPANSVHLVTDAILSDRVRPGVRELMEYFMNHEPYASNLRNILDIYSRENMCDMLTSSAAGELYAEIDKSSISRMETFAKCAFAHFARYGLELEERKIYEINPADMGTIFHRAIEDISSRLKKDNRDFSMISEEERHELVKTAVMDATADYNASFFASGGKNAYLKQRIINILERTVWALGEQIKAGSFVPARFESTFYEKFLDTAIVGKIDRVDLCEEDGKIYVKIIDYKSGANDLTLDDIYNGLKLQLMVYLRSTVDKMRQNNPDKEVIPAAALYNRIDNPIINKPEDGEYEKNILKAFCPTGMVSMESAHLLDEWESGSSLVIPARRKKDGQLSQDGHLITGEQLDCISGYAVNKMVNMEQEIMNGKVDANPLEESCDYCSYKAVCGFNPSRSRYRKPDIIKDEPDKWLKFGYVKKD